MSRPLHLEYEGAVYHVTSRGNEQPAIYRDDQDRERFLSILGSLSGKKGFEIADAFGVRPARVSNIVREIEGQKGGTLLRRLSKLENQLRSKRGV
jgi:DNA-binding HxlR family transcriptional regulator